MSTTIDQKVVEMRFDNSHFEQNVSNTMSSLDKLKQSLNLTGASKGLEEVNSAAKNCNMSPLAEGVEAVRLKFSALQIMGITALTNITNSAINAGKRIASALTIDPIKTGFSEYETQINAVQTILANTKSKGKTLDDVNSALDELNTYADKTIYNFTEMTRNIGTFTAAGVDLDTSVSAIKGIANLAAVSGSTSQQASTAMYQLSQAMASGTVKLMDWNSVVNAGMGGQVFQDALKETARAHGIAIDDIIKKQGSFRESLSEGWLTTKVLTDTLAKFTGDLSEEQLKSMGYTEAQIKDIMELGKTANDAATKVKTFTQLFDTLKEAAQSGWTQTWEIIIGDFEEAKKFLTEISDTIGGMIGSSAEARNELLENWKVLGGRDDLLQSLKNAFEAVIAIVKPIKEAFRDIFPPMTAEKLVAFTEGLKNLTAKLIIGEETADKIKRTFKGLFAVVDIVKQIFVAAFKAISPLIGGVGDLGGGILSVTAAFGDWLVGLDKSIKKSDILNKAFQGISGILSKLIDIIKNIAKWFKVNLIEPILGVGDAATEMGSCVTSAFDGMGDALKSSSMFKIMQSIWNGITKIATGIGKVVGGIFDAIAGGGFQGFLDFLNGLVSSGIGLALMKFLLNLADSAKELGSIKEGITDILDGVSGSLEAFQNKLKAEALQKIATAVAILAAAIFVLSFVDKDKLANAMVAITALFTELMVAMSVFTKIIGKDKLKGVTQAIASMIAISASVLILAAALRIVAGLEFKEMMTGLIGVAGLMAVVVGAIKVLGTGGKSVIKGATQMVIFAAAITILASVCEDLSYLGWEGLAKGITGILGLAGVMVATAKILSMGKNKDVIKGATQMVIFAAAIKVLASVCEDLSDMSWKEIEKGLIGMAGILAEIVIFTKLTSNAGKVMSTGVAMIAMAAAMKIFASAMQDMATMSWEEIAKGLVSMAGALAAITIALNLMPKHMAAKAVALIAIASALLILSNAVGKMGSASWESIGKSMTVLAGSLTILAVALHAMKSTLSGSAALLVAATSLMILSTALLLLGSMSWESIAKGLLAIAGAFVIFGVAGYALQGAVPSILMLAGAMALMGLAVLTTGIGLMAFSAGLTSLAVAFTAIEASIGAICTGIVKLASSLIEGLLKGVADGIVAFCKVIIDGIPAIGEALTVVVLTLCQVLIECLPVIVDTVLQLVVALLDSLASYTPAIVDSLFSFLLAILDGLKQNVPVLIQKVVDVLMAVFEGVVDALGSIDTDTLLKGIIGVGLITALMMALSMMAPLVPGALVGVIGLGIVIAELALVLAAIGAIAQIPGLDWLISEGGYFLGTIGTAIGQFIGGLAGGVAQGFTGSLPQIGTDLSTFMTNIKPFIEGASSIDPSALDGVKSLIGVILALTGANIVEGIASWITGESSLTKFGEEIAEFGPNIRAYADAVTGIDAVAVEASANAAKALADMCSHIPNEGGVAAWFAGENSISKFSSELPLLGEGLKGFSDSIVGINGEAMISAANAAKALAEMTATIPNEGGMVAWFTGENSISKFADDLKLLGDGLKGFSDSTVGINPDAMIAAAGAAQALSDMTNSIPNEGGLIAWITGENSVSKFGNDLVTLGEGLKGFSDAIVGVNPENLTAAANAAQALADMCSYIPNEGGIVAWFTGESSVARFSDDLVLLGIGLKGFSTEVEGVNPESLTAAANAAKALAEMTSYIPTEGGIVAWFTGENSVSKFGSDLTALGKGLKGFATETDGINGESIVAAANAAKALAEMTAVIPNEGGIVAWFSGETSIAAFADKLPTLGKGLKGFSAAIDGINPENVSAAANAAKALAEMTAVIPPEGGIKAWFAGETSIANFADKLPALGSGLKGFSTSVAGINPDNVTAAANAAESISKMLKVMPSNVGKLDDFGKKLVDFGKKLKSYFSKISEIGSGDMSTSSKAIESIKDISKINAGSIKSVASAIDSLTKSVKNMAKDIKSDLKDAGKEAIEAFIKGIEGKLESAKKACKTLVTECADAISDKSSSFKSAGRDLVDGFAEGISQNTYKAEAKATAMAKAAARAAEKALDINSPSKVLKKIGTSVPEGFALGIDTLGKVVITSATAMGDNAVAGVKKSIARIADVINSDIDAQPTIRPVLDLSEVKAGAGTIGSMFDGASVGVMANIGAISSMSNKNNQNGSNDVVSAIDKLRKDIGKVGNTTYQIGDVTFSEDSDVAEAMQTIVRAIKVGRRT